MKRVACIVFFVMWVGAYAADMYASLELAELPQNSGDIICAAASTGAFFDETAISGAQTVWSKSVLEDELSIVCSVSTQNFTDFTWTSCAGGEARADAAAIRSKTVYYISEFKGFDSELMPENTKDFSASDILGIDCGKRAPSQGGLVFDAIATSYFSEEMLDIPEPEADEGAAPIKSAKPVVLALAFCFLSALVLFRIRR